jgi:hypothetical protein
MEGSASTIAEGNEGRKNSYRTGWVMIGYSHSDLDESIIKNLYEKYVGGHCQRPMNRGLEIVPTGFRMDSKQ